MKSEPVPRELWQRHEQEWQALRPGAEAGGESGYRAIWQRPEPAAKPSARPLQ